MFSKSVFRYCKVLFYPPNINIVLFYGKYTDIDVQYQEIYTDILVLSVFFSIIMKTFKNNFFLFVQMLTDTFLLFLSFKKDHTMLVCCCYALYWKSMACHACLLLLIIIITYKMPFPVVVMTPIHQAAKLGHLQNIFCLFLKYWNIT